VTVLRQVVHVARKDLRTVSWVLLMHVLVVAVVTASAVGLVPAASALSFLIVPASGMVATGLLPVGGLLLVWRQYRVRERRRGLAAAAVLAAFWIVESIAPFRIAGFAQAPLIAGDAETTGAAIDIVWTRSMRNERAGEISAGPTLARRDSPPRHAYLLVVDAAETVMPDGTRRELGTGVEVYWLYTPNVVVANGALAIGSENWPRGSSFRHWQFDMDDAQRAAVADGRARVVLHGRVHQLRPRLAALLPVERGASAAEAGSRFRIEDVQRTGDELTLTTHTTELELANASRFGWIERETVESGPFEYALVVSEREDAVVINSTSGSGSSLALVLPGTRVWNYTGRLETPSRYGNVTAPPLGPNPQLAIIDWELVATHRVTTEMPSRETLLLRVDAGR
jgi:hypothetical protein